MFTGFLVFLFCEMFSWISYFSSEVSVIVIYGSSHILHINLLSVISLKIFSSALWFIFLYYHTEVFNVSKLSIFPLCCLFVWRILLYLIFIEILLVFSKFYGLTFNPFGINFLCIVWGKDLFFSCLL